MKILSITAQKPDSTGSGVYLSELVRNWQAAGHAQAVVAGCGPEDAPRLPEGVTLYPVRYESPALPFPVLGMSDEMPYESTRYRDLSGTMFQQFRDAFHQVIQTAVDREKPDLLVCHHLYLLTALVREWFPDAVILGLCHGSDLRQLEKNPFLREEVRSVIPRLDRIAALQEAQRSQILSFFGCAPSQVSVVGAGYNQDIFSGPHQSDPQVRRLVFAGKVTEKKGVCSLLRALSHVSLPPQSLTVTIAGGHGSEEEYRSIRQLAQHCPYPVAFPGPLPQQELAQLFRRSDVFVLPSFFEGLPLVTIEAMACGCRVVCSDLPGVRDWYDRVLPGHGVRFVPLPRCGNVDEPLSEELPAFEVRLAQAIETALHQQLRQLPDMTAASWKGVSQRLLSLLP